MRTKLRFFPTRHSRNQDESRGFPGHFVQDSGSTVNKGLITRLPRALLGAILVFFAPMGASAGDVAAEKMITGEIVEFSADTVQQIPNQDPVPGKLYVSKGKIRMEIGAGDEHRIIIFDSTAKKTLHLNPARKEYMEVQWPTGKSDRSHASTRQPLPGDPNHLCTSPQLECTMLGKGEKIGDRTTEKWEIVRKIQMDGQKPRTMRFLVWVDRKLGANVREERYLDGEIQGSSEFRDIKEGVQPETLFQVPTNYQRVPVPSPQSPAH
uniref:DUF4412 domain-containing protein n=1 Tax=Candidatus Kentrum sp. FM TaxID=2126340 RepID=A0A450TQK4_9GAMM|nr:MAG: hypothetical protein BECKFM1743A_GA0114220_105443 [Candidatus Kentron sp. FM]VFJ72583.1 MAG: hypothetical protein BECKFM1743C_GA0114222_106602 [Candidatus Kentron sp. FM]VFK20907.1 MAG: hypothetical protein BECKFM1743B_GA0114221_107412 [Candidatus Kentron sp. FM]